MGRFTSGDVNSDIPVDKSLLNLIVYADSLNVPTFLTVFAIAAVLTPIGNLGSCRLNFVKCFNTFRCSPSEMTNRFRFARDITKCCIVCHVVVRIPVMDY